MAGQNIDAAFAAILKDCQAIAAEAVKNSAKKVQNDVIKEAESCLQKYYNNYKPKRYKRTYQLQKAITPVLEDHSNGSNLSIEVGVEYDSGRLKGAYHSNSRWHQSGDTWRSVTDRSKFSSDNGIPEPEWIMNNFLDGVHPWAQTDAEPTDSLMKKFFDSELPNRINQYVQDELFGVITSRL